MNVVLATSNAGKLREFETLGAQAGWTFELPQRYEAPVEDGTTYAENAAIKAQALWWHLAGSGTPSTVLGDDSGLEILALQGRPGLLSARYLDPEASWAARRQALLAEVAATGSQRRGARFVCALHLIDAEGRTFRARAGFEGRVADRERGTMGFSYDPIFIDPESGRTFGELSEAQKNAKSHRARAFAELVALTKRTPLSS